MVPEIRTIVTWLDASASEARLERAVELAASLDAHLTALVVEAEPSAPGFAYGEASAEVLVTLANEARQRLDARSEKISSRLAGSGVRIEVESLLATSDQLPRRIAARARYADLCCLPVPAKRENSGAAAVTEEVLFEQISRCLVVPEDMNWAPGESALIAWDGGAEAMRAVHAALPFLRASKSVDITIVDADATVSEDLPGAELAAWLSRHGIMASVTTIPRGSETIANALKHRAVETGAGLLVMGAYSHSRFREMMLGGPTRDMLNALEMPAIMAH